MDVGAGRAGGSSTGAGHKCAVPSTSHNPPSSSSTTPVLAGGLQLKGSRWESGTNFSTTATGWAHGPLGTPHLASVWPPRPTSSGGPHTSARAPAPPPGPPDLETTSGIIPTEMEEEQGNDRNNITSADSAGRARSIGITRESNRSVWQATSAAALRTEEGGTTAVATAAAGLQLQQQAQKQKKELRQLHESNHKGAQGHQQVQMTLSSLLSSPSLLCRTHYTHQTTGEGGPTDKDGEDKARGRGVVDVGGGERKGGSGGGGGNYRSVCSCPAIGATATSPLFARHELTDRSALERSQRLVSWGLQRSANMKKPAHAHFHYVLNVYAQLIRSCDRSVQTRLETILFSCIHTPFQLNRLQVCGI